MARKKIENLVDESPEEMDISAEEIGASYFEDHPECPVNSILVCTDGTIFYNTPVGSNAADNYGQAYTVVDKN